MWHRLGTHKGVLLFSFAQRKGVFSGIAQGCVVVRGLSRSAPGAIRPESPNPTTREMRNDHRPSLLFRIQMRFESLIGEELVPGPMAVWWDH